MQVTGMRLRGEVYKKFKVLLLPLLIHKKKKFHVDQSFFLPTLHCFLMEEGLTKGLQKDLGPEITVIACKFCMYLPISSFLRREAVIFIIFDDSKWLNIQRASIAIFQQRVKNQTPSDTIRLVRANNVLLAYFPGKIWDILYAQLVPSDKHLQIPPKEARKELAQTAQDSYYEFKVTKSTL